MNFSELVVLPLEEVEILDPDELLDPPLSVWKNGERLGIETGRALLIPPHV
jgi:hypothetical protein